MLFIAPIQEKLWPKPMDNKVNMLAKFSKVQMFETVSLTKEYFVPQLETTNKNKSCASEEVVADVAKLTRPLWQDLPKAAHCSAEGRESKRIVDSPQVAES